MTSFHIISLFPEFFCSPLATSLLGKATQDGSLNFTFHNPRDYSENKHLRVDDAPYGGGYGMVMQPDPIARAIISIPTPGRMILFSPAGRPLTAAKARELAREANLTLICGRYEGIDSRILEAFPQIEEISVGEAILNGGETAALALIESVARFLPGFLGKPQSLEEESAVNGLAEYSQYTRPEHWNGLHVPQILLGGNHVAIATWRREEAVRRTWCLRPEWLASAPLDKKDAETLGRLPRCCLGRRLSFALLHYPVKLEKHRIGPSSLTNLDVHDIARITRSYGMGPFFILTPLRDQLQLLQQILAHWKQATGTDRSLSLETVRAVTDFNALDLQATMWYGVRPHYLGTSAQWPEKKNKMPLLTPHDVREMLSERPVVICLGTGRGLALEQMEGLSAYLRPLRFLNDNHLSVRSAAAIIADRILGDFH